MFNHEKLYKEIKSITDKNDFLIAYSGGIDSHVLLHSAAKLRASKYFNIRAIHINHGISNESYNWEQHCIEVCSKLKIEIIVKRIKPLNYIRNNIEECAREARYCEFAKTINNNEVLLTAHHANDQAETLFLQLFRGSGPTGLSAIPKYRIFDKGFLARPLLKFTRNDIENYAEKNFLQWIEDESNDKTNFSRNFIRHELMPIIRQKWPGIINTVNRSAENCARACELNEILAKKDYEEFKGSKPSTLAIDKLLNFTESRLCNLLRYWLKTNNDIIPSKIILRHIIKDVMTCSDGADPVVRLGNTEVRRYRNDLYAIKPEKTKMLNHIIVWNGISDLHLPENLGILPAKFLKDIEYFEKEEILIKFRATVKKCKIKGRKGTHDVKKIFQEKGIPTWQRNTVPLIFQRDELIAIFEM